MPAVEVLDDAEPAPIAERAGELGEPGPQAVGDPVGDPDADLRLALDRVLPAVRLLHAHAEDARRPACGPSWRGIPWRSCRWPMGASARSAPAGRRTASGASSPIVFMSSGLVAPPPVFGITQESGLILRTSASQSRHSSKRRCCCQRMYAVPRRVLRVVGPRQVVPGRGPEVRPAMLAIAHAGAGPAVDEDPVDAVPRHDLPVHRGHELEVVRPQGAGHPHLRRGPVPARLALGVHGDPVGMRVADVVVGRVRVGPRQHDHAELPAARDQLAERSRDRPATGCGGGTGPRSGSRRRSRRHSGRPPSL